MREHEESISLVTRMNEEFETIDVLKTFYIIKRYLEERDRIGTTKREVRISSSRRGGSSGDTSSRTSKGGVRTTVDLQEEREQLLEMLRTHIEDEREENPEFGEHTFESERDVKLFMYLHEQYKQKWRTFKSLSGDDLFAIANKYHESLIAANSLAGAYEELSEQVQGKRAVMEGLSAQLSSIQNEETQIQDYLRELEGDAGEYNRPTVNMLKSSLLVSAATREQLVTQNRRAQESVDASKCAVDGLLIGACNKLKNLVVKTHPRVEQLLRDLVQ